MKTNELSNALNVIEKKFIEETKLLLEFVKDIEEEVNKQIFLTTGQEYTKSEKEELKKFALGLLDVAANKKSNIEIKIKSEKVEETIFKTAKRIRKVSKYKEFLFEMSLNHLITFYEAFIFEYYTLVFSSKPFLLKTEKKQISFEEIGKFKSMTALNKYLAEKEIKDILGENIDKIADYFERKFKFTISSEFKDWTKLKEILYRRNLIVHNRGIADDKYCKNTGFKGIRKKIITDARYVEEAVAIVINFIEYINLNIKKKLKLEITEVSK